MHRRRAGNSPRATLITSTDSKPSTSRPPYFKDGERETTNTYRRAHLRARAAAPSYLLPSCAALGMSFFLFSVARAKLLISIRTQVHESGYNLLYDTGPAYTLPSRSSNFVSFFLSFSFWVPRGFVYWMLRDSFR